MKTSSSRNSSIKSIKPIGSKRKIAKIGSIKPIKPRGKR